MTNYSQRYATGDSNTAGSFYFDTITAVDYPASKVLWGAEGAVNHCSAANPLPVTAVNGGTFAVQAAQSGTWNITNISGTISLPAGAATAAKQPALGTAGTASADVITIQGIASMTAVKVDGSAVTQPVSGTVTANQGGTWTVQPGNTANTTAWLVTGTGGTFPVTDSGGSLTVDNNGTFAVQATVAAAATNIAKAEDAASADADVGVPAMAVRKATPANTSGTDGDYEMLQMSAGRLWVDASGVTLTVGSHAVTNAGTFAVQVDGAALTSLQLLDDAIFTDDAAFTPATSKLIVVGFEADETATDSVDEGDAGAARMTLDRKQIVTDYAHTTGGLTPYKLVSAATTNATSVKASAGQLYEVMCSNVNAAARYIKFYDKASAPTVGTDTPVWTLIIPGNTAGAGIAKTIPKGLVFSSGIAFALTTEATDAGTTAVAANEIVVNLGYK